MYMLLRRGLGVKRLREVRVLSVIGMLTLILIGLIALAESRAPQLYVFRGASPFNDGYIGTMEFVKLIRSRYPYVYTIASIRGLEHTQNADRCLYIVISPEIGYSTNESIYIISKLLSKCNTLSFLIADENTTSNNILLMLNSSIYIQGVAIYSDAYGFYPPAYIDLRLVGSGSSADMYRVYLDIASPIILRDGRALVFGRTVDGYNIASYERISIGGKNVSIVVIGDGSIFLNQVLRSNISVYRSLAMGLVDILCSYDYTCSIIVDGSHYKAIAPQEISFRSISSLSIYQDPITIALNTILRALHPSTWFVDIVELINNFINSIRNNLLLSIAISFLLMVIAYEAIIGIEMISGDERISEVRETEVFVFRDLRESIARGRYRLTKHDFINLFEMVNSVFISTIGIELCSDGALQYVSKLVGTKNGRKYIDRMCRGYRKALRGGLRPFIFSWNRFTIKMIRESENILNSMGYALTKEKGVEYIFLR